MRYVLLLRGINVGGKHQVVMAELKQHLEAIGLDNVVTYINSGNIFFDSTTDKMVLQQQISELLANQYAFEIGYVLISRVALQEEINELPDWWYDDVARKDVLFYLSHANQAEIEAHIRQWSLGQEQIHFGQQAIFLGKQDNDQYLETAYAKYLAKAPFYKAVSVRNGKTFDKIQTLLGIERA